MERRVQVAVTNRQEHLLKHSLIRGMVVRFSCEEARARAYEALRAFPLILLLLAHDYPTRIWLLDEGESPASVFHGLPLPARFASHPGEATQCEGVTLPVNGGVAIFSSWSSLLVLRHEFAHAVTTFLSPQARVEMLHRYRHALECSAFVEPLASLNPAEYAACGLSSYLTEERRERLEAVDPALAATVHRLMTAAERVSRMLHYPTSANLRLSTRA